MGKPIPRFTGAAIEVLLASSWPGNVRQLRATICRAVLLGGDDVTEEQIDCAMMSPQTPPGVVKIAAGDRVQSLREDVRQQTRVVERMAIIDALRRSAGNKAEAARLLQIDYKTIHSKIKEYGIMVERE